MTLTLDHIKEKIREYKELREEMKAWAIETEFEENQFKILQGLVNTGIEFLELVEYIVSLKSESLLDDRETNIIAIERVIESCVEHFRESLYG
ncbi:hypothetical protein ES703_82260 [subsurface metagenome]